MEKVLFFTITISLLENFDSINLNLNLEPSSHVNLNKFTPSENLKINNIFSRIVQHKEFLISNVYLQWFDNTFTSTTMKRPDLFLGTPNPSHELYI